MNRGRRFAHAMLLVMCMMIAAQYVNAEEVSCEHHFVEIEIPGDCTNPGMSYQECSICGEQIDFKNTPALGHNFSPWETEIAASCTENGVESRVCRRCGLEEERTTPESGHRYEDEVNAPTCTKSGRVYSVCRDCGDRILQKELPALGHDYDEGVITKEPTTRAMGRKTFTCQHCGETRTVTIPRLEEASEKSDVGSANANHSAKRPHRTKSKRSTSSRHKSKTSTTTDCFQEAMNWAEQEGISDGMGTVALTSETVCTRAQTIMCLWLAEGAPSPDTDKCEFSDVSADEEYYEAVLWAWENGITKGIDAAHFGPSQRCTRAQAITLLYMAEGAPECQRAERFKDVNREDYFYQPVIWALQEKITRGVGNYQFGSYQSCTWGQLATFLQKVYG